MIKVGVVGATGYTGIELLRLLVTHQQVQLSVLTSRSEQGKSVAEVFPALRGYTDIEYVAPDSDSLLACDVVFFATPHATAMHQVPSLLEAGKRVVDLSADFRLDDPSLWAEWYGEAHACPQLLQEAVYGLPEINRDSIKKAQLVASPGCYPTAIILGLLPAIAEGLIKTEGIIADAKSGVTGAGRKASINKLYAEVSQSFKAYGVSGHRHLPEICQVLNSQTDASVALTFVPHLVPMMRGIQATLYAEYLDTGIHAVYAAYYQDELFVDVMPQSSHPDTRSVYGTNMCRISVHEEVQTKRLIIQSVIDNLTKGAAGQAIQAMNIMFGFEESAGLLGPALSP